MTTRGDQILDRALSKVGDALQRMRELAVQSRNSTNSSDDKDSLNKEFVELQSEINRVLGGTSFNPTVVSNMPTVSAALSYDPNNVFLNVNVNFTPGGGLSVNQQNVANTLNSFFNSGGTLTGNFGPVFGLTGSNLTSALSQLSGEVGTGAEREPEGPVAGGGRFR